MELMEDRRLLSAALTVSQALMVFNDVKNSGTSPVETLTLTNTGDAALSLNGLSIVNDPSQTTQSATRFTLVNAASAPASLAPGGSFGLQVDYAATAVGLDYALLDIATSDPNIPVAQIQLHGIGTAGLGGGNQPSLERILQAYDEPNYNDVGETNEASAYYPEPPGTNSDEVPLQELTKAGPGPVTIDVLASFTAASTKPYTLGWYNVADPSNSQQQLFYTPTSESQSVYVQPQGLTSFDPGSTVFGFYNPSATVKVNNQLVTGYSQDDLNTYDTTDQRKFRFFPLETATGSIVPNSYIMTSTEYFSPAGYDFTNIVAIVSNVKAATAAPTGPVLSVSNPVALAGSNTLIFNRIQNQNTTVGDTVHDTNTITLENTGQGSLTISNITVAATTGSNGGTQYELVNPPTFPLTLAAGQTQAVEVKFVLSQTNANGHSGNETNSAGNGGGGSDYPGILTITSNDANAPTTTIPMEGWWQEHSENENEPDLQTIVNMMAGYGTDINPSQTNFLDESTATNSTPVYYGEEVVSAYWAEADTTQPVQVQQIAAYHTQGDTSGLKYFVQGSSSTTSILNTGSDVGQTFFPLNSAGTAPATGSFSTTSNFGFEVLNPNTYSDDTKNVGDAGGGHLIRFYPVRDASGNLIPNTYILANDYPNGTSENFDFQDNVYLITNIHPVVSNTVSAPQTTGGAASPAAVYANQVAGGVSVTWVPVIDSTLVGYNIYSSLSPTTGYTLLNSTPVTGINYVDTTALPGETIYYQVAAVDSIGVGIGPQTSVLTSGTPSTNLQAIAINESPAGSITTVTQNQAYVVTAGGPGVTGTSSGLSYLFAPQTGNFDVAVQVGSISVAGSYATAGIMASDGLSASSANVYMSASPANYRFKYRATDGATEQVTAGTTAPTFPKAWVRLTRVGDVFSGYTSTDGIVWTLMGQQTLSAFPATCYLGLAVAANTTTATTTANLANYGNTLTYTGPVTVAQSYTAVSGETVQESVLSEDEDPTGTIQPSTFTITTPPNEGGTATFNPTTGLLSYTSATGFVGTETLAYTVKDSNNVTSAPALLTFTVTAAKPVAASYNFTAVGGQAAQFNILANDTDSTGTLNPASVEIVTQPNSAATISVDITTGIVTYVAPSTFSGTDTFTYTVADYNGQVSDPGTLTVAVTAAPASHLVTEPVTATAISGIATTINVLANDSDSNATILPGTVSIAVLPNHGGTATVNADGTITYTPASNFGGAETFLYTVKDSAGFVSSATSVTVTVSNPATAPIAPATATNTITANGSLAINAATSVISTVGLDLSTLAVGTAPAHGTTSINASTGVITYTPTANYVGPDTFTYSVSDINGNLSNLATVNVNVGLNIGSLVGDDRSLTFTSGGGAITTLSLNRGNATVLFNNGATVSVSRKGVATVSGSSLQISDLQLTLTTIASSLSITAGKGKGTFNIGGITDASPIKAITAPNAMLTGTVNLAGIASLQVSQANNTQMTVGTAVPGGFSITAGSLGGATLTSTALIRSIKASTWTSSTAAPSAITAPAITSLAIAGNFEPTLNLTGGGVALRSAAIKGSLGGNAWNISGGVGTVTAGSISSSLHATVSGAITSFTVLSGGFASTLTAASARTVRVVGNISQGAALDFTSAGLSLNTLSVAGSITGASLITTGNVGSIIATSLSDDSILIGAASGTTLANATTATTGTASLSTLHLTARGTTAFANTELVVHTLGSAALGIVDTTTANPSPDGIALESVRSITGTENGSPLRFTSASKASSVFGTFEIELVSAL